MTLEHCRGAPVAAPRGNNKVLARGDRVRLQPPERVGRVRVAEQSCAAVKRCCLVRIARHAGPVRVCAGEII